MLIVLCEPNKFSEITTVKDNLESYQKLVGGPIQAIYPFEDRVALVCNENAKLEGLEFNRCLKRNGEIYDILAGTFFICGLGDEDFCDLTGDLLHKYSRMFKYPQYFMKDITGSIIAIDRFIADAN